MSCIYAFMLADYLDSAVLQGFGCHLYQCRIDVTQVGGDRADMNISVLWDDKQYQNKTKTFTYL